MKTIWKYSLEVEGSQTIAMPWGAEILTIQMQKGVPYLWVLVFPENDVKERKFITYGTGHPIKQTQNLHEQYIGTYQPSSGLVFHVFELAPGL